MSTVLIIVIVVVVVLAIWFFATRNALNVANLKIEEASSDIDVALEKRYDLLTKMIDTCKSYCKYEKDTFANIIAIRKGMSMSELAKADESMNEAMGRINVLAENYPDLKASENYKMLQSGIADCEEHLAAAKRLYNANVSKYNSLIVSFPSSIVAGSSGNTKKDYYKVDDAKKSDVKIDI